MSEENRSATDDQTSKGETTDDAAPVSSGGDVVPKRRRFQKLKDISRWRRIAIGMWSHSTSPTVYGEQRLDMTKVKPFLVHVREELGVKISPLHVFLKAVGDMFREYPHYNVMLRRRKFYQRATADVFIQVAIKEGAGDLGGIKISSVDQKTVLDLSDEIASRAAKVRAYQDKDMEKTKKSMERTPTFLMPLVVRTVDILTNDLGANLSFMGLKPDPWGGAMVTNIGSFGLPHGYAPLIPAARVPILFCLGAVTDEAMVIDGEVVARPVLSVTGTFDHRMYDGMQLAKISSHIKLRFENPEWLLEELAG